MGIFLLNRTIEPEPYQIMGYIPSRYRITGVHEGICHSLYPPPLPFYRRGGALLYLRG